MKTRISWLALAVVAAFAFPASARENVADWYVQDFHSRITANKDSSLDIVEDITADCGTAQGKHGIFRILPEDVKVEGKTIRTPVELISITDFNDKPIEYSESRNSSDDTVTWKIGDASKTVQGVNYYKIHYKVKNAIRFGNQDFDELYWNLSGNFWDLEIDHFRADITFPSEITKDNSQVYYYTGYVGEKGNSQAAYLWLAPDVLQFETNSTLLLGQGVTASVTFPKGIFIQYVPGFWETYGQYFSLLVPLAVFIVCFLLWWKYGKDPRIDKTVIAEYEAPGKLSPIELGMLMTNGGFKNSFVTAEIINLATKGLITIKETDKKILFFNSKDYELTKNSGNEAEKSLNAPQKIILDKIFENGTVIKLSSLKNDFYKILSDVQRETKDILKSRQLITGLGMILQMVLIGAGIMILILMKLFLIIFGSSPVTIISIAASCVIMIFFGFMMPKRTKEGAELNWQIKGFKLFMETVDKDRAEFYEKENIFEKCLPYAIVFGMTKIWIRKMEEIYGKEFFANHPMVWYVGSSSMMDADGFLDSIDSLSSSIASNTSSPSGAGGAGGSGGGGGGGGGGGW